MTRLSLALVCSITLASVAGSAPPPTGAGKAFKFSGSYVEGCSCMGVCPCELTGVAMGCQGVGAFQVDNATFDGMNLSGVRAAYALSPGAWVDIYIDAPAGQHDAAVAFMKAALAGFGPAENIKDAKIAISGHDGAYTATVDGGDIMSITTEPVLGLDKKHALQYNNVNDPLHPIVMQGKTIDCKFKDGSHEFTLKGTNAYFNDHIHSQGVL